MKLLRSIIAVMICSLFTPVFAVYYPYLSRFGGDGLDGNANITGTQTESVARQYNYNQYLVGASGLNNVLSGHQIFALNTFTVSGTVSVGQGFAGGSPYPGATFDPSGAGMGPCPGGSGQNVLNTVTNKKSAGGGGGGGCGGSGGTGGAQETGHLGGLGGNAIANVILPGMSGSGGGAGYDRGIGQDGPGGAGGGRLVALVDGAISIPSGGIVRANGQAGTAGITNGSGGGGGSGGVNGLFSKVSISIAGALNANGAVGGNGAGTGAGGGGGGGGINYLMAPSISVTGSMTESSGSAGSGGLGAATAGSAGYAVTVTGSPNLPLMVYLLEHPKVFRAIANERNTNVVALNKSELCKIASEGNRSKEIALMHDDNELSTEFACDSIFAPSKREEKLNAA